MKLLVLHFNPIEKYPPIMNLLNYMEGKDDVKIQVCSTKNTSSNIIEFEKGEIRINRYGKNSINKTIRYFTYIYFNLMSYLKLLFFRPDSILVYESLSVLPAFFYKKLFRNIKIYIHYHEYTSPLEYQKSSAYYKLLEKAEKKLYSKVLWISHTNHERLKLFQFDNKEIVFKCLKVMPNYPPLKFYESGIKHEISKPVKFVYCGVLSIENMFFEEFVNYITEQNGNAICHFYVMNCSENIKEYFKTSNENLKLFPEITYFKLPYILNNYDVGIVLHKGDNLNYKYNLPNKILEYLSSGLEVWCSNQLVTVSVFKNDNKIENLKLVDFENSLPVLNSIINNSKNIKESLSNFNAERIYYELYLNIIKNNKIVN